MATTTAEEVRTEAYAGILSYAAVLEDAACRACAAAVPFAPSDDARAFLWREISDEYRHYRVCLGKLEGIGRDFIAPSPAFRASLDASVGLAGTGWTGFCVGWAVGSEVYATPVARVMLEASKDLDVEYYEFFNEDLIPAEMAHADFGLGQLRRQLETGEATVEQVVVLEALAFAAMPAYLVDVFPHLERLGYDTAKIWADTEAARRKFWRRQFDIEIPI